MPRFTLSPDFMPTIEHKAAEAGIEPAMLKAFTIVEGRSVDIQDGVEDGFVNGKVMILTERHKFYKHLKGDKAKLNKAVKAGLANEKMGGYPKSQEEAHKRLEQMRAIDDTAGLKSISMGIYQVLGENYALCGYATVQSMWAAAQTLVGQIDMGVRFLKGAGLLDEMQRHDFKGLARGYNGSKYAEFHYDTKIEAAYKEFGGDLATVKAAAPPSDWVGMGDQREDQVTEIQRRLRQLGYHVEADGDFGTLTRRAVMAFQAEHGLKVDGKVGTKTRDMLWTASPDIPEEVADATVADLQGKSKIIDNSVTLENGAKVGTGLTLLGAGAEKTGLLDKVGEVADRVSGFEPIIYSLQGVWGFLASNMWLVLVAIGGGVGFYAWHIKRARLEDHRSGKTVLGD